MPVTLEEIARESGFSVPTVSRVLGNSSYPVSRATRARILEVARAMGYRPNLAARSLRTERTNTIGIIVDDILSPFVPPIVRGVQDFLKPLDYVGLIVNSDWDSRTEQEAIDALLSRPVDGLIFVEYSHRASSEPLETSNKPYVFAHRLFGSQVKNSVVPDDYSGANLAVRHLIGLGHRRIAYINGPESWHNARQRLAGYQHALQAAGLPDDPALIQSGDWEYDSGCHAASALLALDNPPTAIFAANDLMALGAIDAARETGLAVPGQVAVIGYDNREFTRIVRPRMTTVSLPAYEMGRAAAELLLRQITEGRQELDEIRVQGQLIVRETCGAEPSLRTPDEVSAATAHRRILLHRDPDA